MVEITSESTELKMNKDFALMEGWLARAADFAARQVPNPDKSRCWC